MKLVVGEAVKNFRIGSSATGLSTSFSMALIGVGHLVGLSVGAAMFFGMIIAWAGLMPYLTSGVPGELDTVVSTVFRNDVRFIGAGTIGVAAIWTLLKILGPIIGGIRSALAASRARQGGSILELTERDLPIGIVGASILATLPPMAYLLWSFSAGGPIHDHGFAVIAGTILYILIIGVVIAAVCGYMAGLIGASNSPVSGVGILAVLGASLLLVAIYGHSTDIAQTNALIAYALFTTAIVFSVATISNDNLQDLKTGQLVGATPWKQQFALVLGVIFGSLVIPPVLDLLNTAFTFQGAPNAKETALAAPQAALISSLAKGVLGGDLDWRLIGTGAGIGVAVIFLDEMLGRAGRMRLPPLAIGMGIYLPNGADAADPGRRADRPFLRSLGETDEQPGLCRAHGNARGHRADRRREPVRGGLCRHRRRHGQRCAAGDRGREFRDDRAVRCAGRVRWVDLAALQPDQVDGAVMS